MDFKKFGKRYVIRLDKGEEVIKSIKDICNQEGIKSASIMGIGATNNVTIGIYELSGKKYHKEQFRGDFEITSLTGNIVTSKRWELIPHIHINIGDRNFNVIGGHLNSCTISITCEIFMDVLDGEINKVIDEELGINLFKF